jgi:hypothetical protein
MRRFIRELASLSLDLDILFSSELVQFGIGVIVWGLLALIVFVIFLR